MSWVFRRSCPARAESYGSTGRGGGKGAEGAATGGRSAAEALADAGAGGSILGARAGSSLCVHDSFDGCPIAGLNDVTQKDDA